MVNLQTHVHNKCTKLHASALLDSLRLSPETQELRREVRDQDRLCTLQEQWINSEISVK
jgi:hypothetical protein